MSLQDIIARLEKAEGPDRELDGEIGMVTGPWTKYDLGEGCWQWRFNGANDGTRPPSYTSSVDCALTLVPEGWTAEINWREAFDKGSSCVLHEFPEPCRRIPEKHPYVIRGATPAISICIAALRAIASQKGEP